MKRRKSFVRRMIPRVLKEVCRRLTTPSMAWNPRYHLRHLDHSELICDDIAKVRKNTMVSPLALAALWEQVRYVDEAKVEGALVECGVWKGGSVALMGLAHSRSGKPHRELHLFDNFEMFPEPDAIADGEASIKKYAAYKASGRMPNVGTLEDCANLLEKDIHYPSGLIKYHKGWFQDTLPSCSLVFHHQKIAILRLDGDWYESTKVCFSYLYDLVSEGGVVICDDYGAWEGCKKATDEFLLTLPRRPLLINTNGQFRYFVKR